MWYLVHNRTFWRTLVVQPSINNHSYFNYEKMFMACRVASYLKGKWKRSNADVWQTSLNDMQCKPKVYSDAAKTFDYTTVMDRLGRASSSDNSNPPGLVNLKLKDSTFQIPTTVSQLKEQTFTNVWMNFHIQGKVKTATPFGQATWCAIKKNLFFFNFNRTFFFRYLFIFDKSRRKQNKSSAFIIGIITTARLEFLAM